MHPFESNNNYIINTNSTNVEICKMDKLISKFVLLAHRVALMSGQFHPPTSAKQPRVRSEMLMLLRDSCGLFPVIVPLETK